MPSFSLAEKVKELGFNVVYAVADNNLQEFISENNFEYVFMSGYKILFNQEVFFLVEEKKKRASFRNFCGTLIKNELYRYKRKELCKVMKAINPKIVFIDIFSSTRHFEH